MTETEFPSTQNKEILQQMQLALDKENNFALIYVWSHLLRAEVQVTCMGSRVGGKGHKGPFQALMKKIWRIPNKSRAAKPRYTESVMISNIIGPDPFVTTRPQSFTLA